MYLPDVSPPKFEMNGNVGTDHYSYRPKRLVTTGAVSWLIILYEISILTQSLNTHPAHEPHACDTCTRVCVVVSYTRAYGTADT